MERWRRWVHGVGPVVVGGSLAVMSVLWLCWMLTLSPSRQSSASGLGQFILALIGTMVPVGGLVARWWSAQSAARLSTPDQVDEALDVLAGRMLTTWRGHVVQRGIQTPAPVQVRWRWARTLAGPPEEFNSSPSLPTDPLPVPGTSGPREVAESGVVTRLHDEVFARLRHGMLILVGDAGSGKTAAMMMLLLEILRHRQGLTAEARSRVPVPLWLTLSTWDPRRQGLREWVAAVAGRDHPYLRARDFGPNAIEEMLDDGRVTLLLDGLDEMPPALRTRALGRLRQEAGGLRVILTSRSSQYREAAQTETLPFAAVVELRPVPADAAAEYLLSGTRGTSRHCWQRVADQLALRPESVASRTLTTPLTLSLARTAYAHADPTVLLSETFATERSLRRHLLEQVLVCAYPDEKERARATHTLGWIAHRMGPSRDLRWWRIPDWVPRRDRGLVCGILVAAGSLTAVGPFYGLRAGLAAAVGAGILTGARTGHERPRTLLPRWPVKAEVGRVLAGGLRAGCLAGCVVGLGDGLAYGPVQGLVNGLIVGLPVVPVGGLLRWWCVPLRTAPDTTPVWLYRKDVRSQLVTALMVMTVSGFLGVLLASFVFTMSECPAYLLLAGWPGARLVIGAGMGAAIGLLLGVVLELVPGASWSLFVAEAALWVRGQGRLHSVTVLETALRRQVLRQAGAMYQFRHAELQDHLAAMHRHGQTCVMHRHGQTCVALPADVRDLSPSGPGTPSPHR